MREKQEEMNINMYDKQLKLEYREQKPMKRKKNNHGMKCQEETVHMENSCLFFILFSGTL